MKTKNYIADFNAIVVAKFDFAEITLYYRNAHKEAGKSGAFYTMITEGTDFIAVGTDGNLKMFNNWDDAAEYAKALTGDYYVGVRPSGNVKYQVLAKCENKAETEVITEAAPAESNNGLVEKVAEIVKKVKCREEINVSKEVCQKNGIDVSSWPVFVANLTKNSDNNYAVKVYIYNNACEILAKFNHDTGSKRWSEAIEYDVAAYIVDTLTEYVSQSEEYKKAEAEAVKALPF